MSGLSVEFLKALCDHQEAVEAIRCHMDLLLRDGIVLEDYASSFVCLIPKLEVVTRAKDFRRVNLVETMMKVYTTILTKRVTGTWLQPKCQLGGLPGFLHK